MPPKQISSEPQVPECTSPLALFTTGKLLLRQASYWGGGLVQLGETETLLWSSKGKYLKMVIKTLKIPPKQFMRGPQVTVPVSPFGLFTAGKLLRRWFGATRRNRDASLKIRRGNILKWWTKTLFVPPIQMSSEPQVSESASSLALFTAGKLLRRRFGTTRRNRTASLKFWGEISQIGESKRFSCH